MQCLRQIGKWRVARCRRLNRQNRCGCLTSKGHLPSGNAGYVLLRSGRSCFSPNVVFLLLWKAVVRQSRQMPLLAGNNCVLPTHIAACLRRHSLHLHPHHAPTVCVPPPHRQMYKPYAGVWHFSAFRSYCQAGYPYMLRG